jgi:predicted permease
MYLVRAAERQREMSIRSALGAGRLRMVQQLLTESCIVSILGGGAGLLLAVGGLRSILAAVPGSAVSSLGTLNRASINLPVLGFTFVLSLITGVVVGALPAWKASRLDLVQSLKEGARGTGVSVRRIETQSVLVVVEIALSLILLVGAGLMVESFHRLATVPLGFDPDHVLTLQLPASSYDFRKVTEPSIFYKTVLDRIGAIPSVEAVGMTNDSPLSPLATHLAVALSGVSWAGSSTPVHVDFQDVSSGYFLAMGMRLLQGRYFTADDNNGGPPVAIINNAMANRYWSKENPVGQSLYGNVTIVGVIGDTVQGSLAKKAEPMIYRPFDQQPITAAAIDFVIRTEGDPLRIVPAVRTAVWDISPSQAIVQVRTMNDAIADSVWRPRFTATMLAILALVDLFLTAAGLYGVISHIISKRSREIGIRMALGAQRRDVACMVIGDSLKLSVIGIALGLVGSLATTRLLAGILFSIRPEDPATLIGAILVLTAAAMGASCIPVRRATRVDPVVALRYE